MLTQKILRAALNSASEDHPIKMLEQFQNNKRAAQCLLGECGPLKGKSQPKTHQSKASALIAT